jgi:stage II sporulation protein AA (anti-sigma F factor antagonist)
MLKHTDCIKEITDGKTLTVVLSGELDHHNAVKFRARIDELIQSKKPKTLVLDVEKIDFMDSSGLGLIMGRYQNVQAYGGKLIVRNPGEGILKICRLSGIARFVKIETKQ